jgi:SAM-dependent methyltransferase
MKEKSILARFAFWARNVRSKELFEALKKYSQGIVLDVGGRDFYGLSREYQINHRLWVSVEYEKDYVSSFKDPRYCCVLGDGCRLPFQNQKFDTVISVQVLEHVFEPIVMFNELCRVLKPGGVGVFLGPQTSVLHDLPQHYYNFTPSWLKEASRRANAQVLELKSLGGLCSTTASHWLYFFFKVFRAPGYSSKEFKRNIWFYLFLPLMMIYAFFNILICMILSFGDLSEEANNLLLVIKKN